MSGERREGREAARTDDRHDVSDDTDDVAEVLREAAEAVERRRRAKIEISDREDTAEMRVGVEGAGQGEEAAEGGGKESEIGTLSLLDELEELRERTARTLADFDNYRKRVERERQAQHKYDGLEVLRSLLDIVDNLERALASEGPVEDLKTGVELTLRQAKELLRRHHVSRIDADGEVFDPTVHEAVSRHEEPDLEEPMVKAVLQTGYQMHDRLLRPARVAVAVPGDGAGREDGSED